MAESIKKEKNPPSKIPRYSKSKIPILSTEYKNTLRNVSNKKSRVEEYQNKIALMKHGMHECRRKIFLDSEQMPPSFKIISGASTTSRNVVHTPGGPKRKGIALFKILLYLVVVTMLRHCVNCYPCVFSVAQLYSLIFAVRPSYVKFKAELKDVLRHMVCKKTRFHHNG